MFASAPRAIAVAFALLALWVCQVGCSSTPDPAPETDADGALVADGSGAEGSVPGDRASEHFLDAAVADRLAAAASDTGEAPLATNGELSPGDVGPLATNGHVEFPPLPEAELWFEEKAESPFKGMVTWFYRVRHTPAKDLIALLNQWKSPQGKIVEFAHQNMIVITDAKDRVPVMQRILEECDQIAPHVQIDAKVIEIRKTYGFEFGFELRVDRSPASNSALRSFGSTFQSQSFIDSLRSGVAFQGTQARWASVGRVVEELGDFEYLVHALEAEGYAQVLSQPTIIVHSGQQATLNAVTDVPIQVTNINNNNLIITTQFKSVGVKLNVKARSIGRNGALLDFNPEVSSVVAFQQPQGQAAGIAIPVIAKRDAKTCVDVADGELLVVGGLFQKNTRDDRSGLPIVSQIPIIGPFFGSRDEAEEETEIIFLIQVRILNEATKAAARLRVPPLPDDPDDAPTPNPR